MNRRILVGALGVGVLVITAPIASASIPKTEVRAAAPAYVAEQHAHPMRTLSTSRSLHRRPPVKVAIRVSKPKPKPIHHYSTSRSAAVPSHYGTSYLYAMAKCIRSHESGVYTRNSGNGYYGAYQFSDATWHAQTGLPGHASDYPKAVQDYWFMHTWAKLKSDAARQGQWSTYHFCSYIRP
jgi:hypothetical protein